jgi:hypothetical protein
MHTALRTSARAGAVALLTALAAAACGQPAPGDRPAAGAAPAATPSVAVPAALEVPAAQKLVATLRVDRGSQVYTCSAGAWKLKEPAAVLRSESPADPVEVLHTAGPQWISTADGSAVTGIQSASVSVQGGVPELLLKASSHRGNGLFGAVDFIQRLDTRGGQAPTGGCTEGDLRAVGYTAQYRFYTPVPNG